MILNHRKPQTLHLRRQWTRFLLLWGIKWRTCFLAFHWHLVKETPVHSITHRFHGSQSTQSDFLVAQTVKRLPTMWETRVRSLGGEYPLEKEIANHFSTLAWKIPWMEEPGRLQSMGSQSRTWLSDFTFLSFLYLFLQMWSFTSSPSSCLVYSCSLSDSLLFFFLILLDYSWFTMLC